MRVVFLVGAILAGVTFGVGIFLGSLGAGVTGFFGALVLPPFLTGAAIPELSVKRS